MNIINEIDAQIEKIQQNSQTIKEFICSQGKGELLDTLLPRSAGKSPFVLRAKSLKELRVAAIMDQFTLESYRPECHLLELTPANWMNEIQEFNPELLFIESAWKGKDDLWYRKIDRSSKEIYELTHYCHEQNIPVIFWNKEDPVYTAQFMTTASMADVVFTTDIDCVQRYKTELEHDRVYHLHFAAQPLLHNPVEKYDRKDKFCFAGAYYHKYKHRAEIFDKFAQVFLKTKGIDIYDRNYQNARPEHAFPEHYDSYILGSLPSSQIDIAYKGYMYGINMNSVQQSQTMFARRVFEMMASNTITVGNYSRGLKNYFGDLTICTDDDRTLENCLQEYSSDSCTARKYRLAGLRAVLSGHLYEDRLDYIVQKVFGISLKTALPMVAMVACCQNEHQANHAIKVFRRQKYPNKRLYILGQQTAETAEDIKSFTQEDAHNMSASLEGVDYYACVCSEDYYGPNYLSDLALTCRYGVYSGIGKAMYYSYEQEQFVLSSSQKIYSVVPVLQSQRSIIGKELVSEFSLWQIGERDRCWEHENLFCADEFNYCAGYLGDSCVCVDDLEIYDVGIPLDKIEVSAEKMSAWDLADDSVETISGSVLVNDLKSSKSIICKAENNDLKISSQLQDNTHEYIFANTNYSLKNLVQGDILQVKFDAEGDLDCICVCVFYDLQGKKIEPQYPKAKLVSTLKVPSNASSIKIGFRPKGKGKYTVHKVILGNNIAAVDTKECFLFRSDVLVISNQYPSPEALYRNMFVHKRMLCYKAEGKVFDVMRMNPQSQDEFREFEGINVIDGGQNMLASMLDSGEIHTVCIHFLDSMMWDVLKDYTNKIRILVWCHGSEIQPWWRREYNYHSKAELDAAKVQSEIRMKFWADIFSNIDEFPDLHFIFVSQDFANGVFQDYKMSLAKERFSIIHNCIDTNMFQFEKKPIEQRKKLLSIRPYASDTYANDLTVKCIMELAKKSYFKDLEIRIIGNGDLFESVLKPVKKFKNVITEKKFLRQDEIAQLHKDYGIFIVPTRMDSQGVSRDEAMSSGLIPITNAVSAIPEFVDDSCGILAPGEDYMAMAKGIDEIYRNPGLFTQMSANAAARVRSQTSKEYTIDKELALICQTQ